MDEFDTIHNASGFKEFFNISNALKNVINFGWLLPWKAITVGRARYKEIFPAPAKTDAIDARRILELFRLSEHLPMAKRPSCGVPGVDGNHRGSGQHLVLEFPHLP
ncbi:MAG: hypothetical protein WBP47_12170 [Candidatus Promineifilaceae bacterium]